MTAGAQVEALTAIRLSQADAAERERLIAAYRANVYEPAFPDASIREDPQYWLDLLGPAEYPPPPQPLIEVVLLARGGEIVAGVTVEYYRTARCGLLTYISVAADRRGRGLGRRLMRTARATLDAMAEPGTPMFAETERLEDAADSVEASETILRQKRLAALGARLVRFDYVMPPLRPDTAPHRLHLMLMDPDREWSDVEAAQVAALMRELAAALGADLGASEDTARMMAALAAAARLELGPLPAISEAG